MRANSMWRSIGAALAGCALLAGCAAEPAGEEAVMEAAVEPTRPTLNVGTSRTVPPIMFEEGGETVGLEADLARELADRHHHGRHVHHH
jgi:ABC-type amino acid transport substrate-binding protein